MTLKSYDATLIVALASGAKLRDAAKIAGISYRTASRRINTSEFQIALNQVHTDILSQATTRLCSISLEAVETLKTLLNADSEHVRLQAAKAILEISGKYTDRLVHEARIKTMEDVFKIVYKRE